MTYYCFVSSAYDYVVPARGKELVKTDLQIELPRGCYGRIAPRSGLAWKNFIDVGGMYKIKKTIPDLYHVFNKLISVNSRRRR